MFFFELKYHFKQASFIVAAILFFGLGIVALKGGFGSGEVHKNGPYVATCIIALLSLFTIFASTVFCANVVLRDQIHKMEEVVFTSSVKRHSYFLVRLLGLIVATFVLLVLTAIGMAIGSIFLAQEVKGDFQFSNYLYPLFVFGLPNVLFSAGLVFCTAILTKNVRAIYAIGVLLYILYMVASIFGNSPLLATSNFKVNDPSIAPFLLDPFGLASFFGGTKSWSDVQRNTLIFPLQGAFLANRILWCCLISMVLAVSTKFFNFRLKRIGRSKQKSNEQKPIKLITLRNFDVVPKGVLYHFSAFSSQFKIELISLFKHIPFMVMLMLWVMLLGIELKDYLFNGPYGMKVYPSTGIIIEEIRSIKFSLILIIFYAAELVSREKTVNIQSLIYATPIKNAMLWSAKCTTLFVLVLTLVTLNIAIGITLQVSNHYYDIDLPSYFTLYYYSAFPLFLFVVLIVFVQSLSPNKYLGMVFSMMVTFVFVFAPRLGIEHYLWRYADVPLLQYSYFNGFGHYAKAFNWYMLYWSSLAGLLAVLTIGMWQGFQNGTFLKRISNIGKQAKGVKLIGLGCAVLFIGSGSYIYWQSNVLGTYKSEKQQMEWRIGYEKRYKKLVLPQPIIKSVKTAVALYPDQGKYEVKGFYMIKNEGMLPISKLWISMDPSVSSFQITVPEIAQLKIDQKYKQQFITLKKPLAPGKELKMDFSLIVANNGFIPFDSENSLSANGSYIELEKFVPHFGYAANFETTDEMEREKVGLPVKNIAAHADRNYHLIELETTISVPKVQHVVTVGTLQKIWNEGDRSYFSYKTAAPMEFMFALSAAAYTIKTEIYKGITLKFCYLEKQVYNLKVMVKAVKDAIDYGSSNFSNYGLKQFVMAEIPQYRGAATAYPGLIFSAEKISFMGNFSDGNVVDQSYAVTAHEVAHQWWANQISPLAIPGSKVLTESLAKYTEAMVAEKAFGKMYLRKYLRDDNYLYFANKDRNGEELPLSKTVDQAYVYYQKGGLVLYGIKEAIGEKKMNAALSRLLQNYRFPNQKPDVHALMNELMKEVTPQQVKLIKDGFEKVVSYGMKIKFLNCKPSTNGSYKLTVEVELAQMEDGSSSVTVPDLDVDIAVFKEQEEDWNSSSKPIYLKKHHFSKTKTIITIEVDEKPKAVAIDPFAYYLDEDLTDNVAQIKL